MKLSTLLVSASLAVSSVFAVPFRHEDIHNEKRQSGYLAVTGISGGVYPRLEIRQMYFNRPNQFTLLLLAMQKWQAMSQSDRASYYQISGIHGVPRVDWDGVSQCSSGCGGDGYCTHDSVLFPAWHRSYVALFEQVFYGICQDVANSYPSGSTGDTMRAAAQQIRWPYWDWAAQPKPGYNSFPTTMAQRYVTVNTPTGTQTIINPLFRYAFHDNSELVYSPFVNNWDYTYRYPNTNNANAVSSSYSVVKAFANLRPSLQDQLFQLLTACNDYGYFSNDDASSSTDQCHNSIEGIHNTVHTTIGGPGSDSVLGGHMTYLSLAAFDPAFWLHHANVDRIFALWQTLNPNSYGAGQTAPHSTWTIAQGSYQDANSPLMPMHKNTNGDFYSTNDVRDWTIFGYTYPEYADSDGSQGAIASYVSALYGPSATATAGSSKRGLADAVAAAPSVECTDPVVTNPKDLIASVASAILPTATANPLSNLTSVISNVTAPMSDLINPVQANNGSKFEYVCNIKTSRYALNGSYQIYLFDGKPTSEVPSDFIFDANLIGPVGILAQPGMTAHNMTVAASIPLTRSLTFALAANLLTDLSEELVVPYLKDNMYWRVVGPSGNVVQSETIPNFEVTIFGSTTPPVSSGELPSYSDFIPLHDAVKTCTENDSA